MKLILSLLVVLASIAYSAESTFSLDFEGSGLLATASRGDRNPTKALPISAVDFTVGHNGNSAYLPVGGERPVYTANRIFSVPEGSVSFWFRPVQWLPGKSARFLHAFQPGKNKELAIHYFQRSSRGDLLFRRVLQADGKKVDVQAVIPASFVSPDAWQQLTCTWNAGEIRLYLNGGLADLRPMPPEAAAMAAFDLSWGSFAVLPVIPSDGDDPLVRTALDDVEVFQGALTAEEVLTRFRAARPGGVAAKFPAPRPASERVTLPKSLEGCLEVAFPRGGGQASVREIGWVQKITADECAFMVDTDAPVILRLASGIFPVKPGASYAVNFTDRPSLYTNADAEGVLGIPLLGATNYTGVCVSPVDPTDLLAGAAWLAKVDAVTNEGNGAQILCGRATRGPSAAPGQAAAFKLEKTERAGKLAWESAGVPVVFGKEYLLTGQYRMRESAYGAKIRFEIMLQGPGRPDRAVRENNLTFYVVPILGAAWRHSQVRVAVPEGYASARVLMSLEGSAQTIEWDGLRLREAPHATTLIPRGRPAEDQQGRLAREAVQTYWERRAPRVVKVDRGQGLPQLRCDGQVVPLLFYNTSANLPQHMEVRAMVKAGLRVHFVPLTPVNRWWRGKESYDFSEAQSNIEAVLENDPEAIVILNVEVTPRYPAWGEENPDLVWRDHDGRKLAGYKTTLHKPDRLPPDSKDVWFPTYSAEGYRAQASAALRALGAHLKSFPTGKAVAGIMLWAGNDGQWQRPLGDMYEGFDHSPGALLDFRRYLKHRYGNDESALRKAWDDPRASFDSAAFPPWAERNPLSWFLDPNPGKDRRVVDANRYGDEGLAQTIKTLGLAMKNAMGGDFLVCTYLHDSMMFGGRGSHQILLESDAIDAIVGIPSYSAFRTAGSVGQVTGALSSYALHGKLHLSEFDVRTHVGHIGKDAYSFLHYTHAGAANEAEFGHLMKRDMAMTLTRGAGAWYLCMPYHTFTTPGYRAQVAAFARIHSNVAARPMPKDRAQMAVYVDQGLEWVVKYGYTRALSAMEVSMPVRTAFNRSGVSFDPYFLSDVAHPDRPRYKVHFFLSAATITVEEIRFIQEKLQRDGNVLVFCNGVGMGSVAGPWQETIRKIAGMTVHYDPQTVGTFRTAPVPGDRMAAGLKDNCEVLWDQPLFWVDDPAATAIGRIVGANRVGWAVRRFPTWTSVYLATAGNITPELIRAIAAEAGLMPIGPNGDVTLAGNGLVAIHALADGPKTLRFSEPRKWIDLDSGLAMGAPTRQLEFPMRSGETRWFRAAE